MAKNASFWGPSLLVLASSVSAAGCRMPGANVQPSQGTRPEQQGGQTPPPVRTPKPKPVRGFAVAKAELQGDGLHLHLHFTRPLAPTQAVDPNDFRLSVGLAYAYKQYAYAYYYDPGYYAGEDEEPAHFVAMHGEGESLELTLAQPFPMSYCVELEREARAAAAEPGIDARGGLFLHYSPGQAPIRDRGGAKLKPAAEAWVLHRNTHGEDEAAYELELEGPKARRAFKGAIPVRCGPELPPGPR